MPTNNSIDINHESHRKIEKYQKISKIFKNIKKFDGACR